MILVTRGPPHCEANGVRVLQMRACGVNRHSISKRPVLDVLEAAVIALQVPLPHLGRLSNDTRP